MKLAAQQNAFFLNAITKVLSGSLLPNPFGFELSGPVLDGCVAIEKNMLDMALEQSTAVIEAIQKTGKAAEKATSEFSKIVHSL